jgi:pimeloyl-ACP methyl ester carboxylesterase
VAALDLRGHGASDPGEVAGVGTYADDVLAVAAAAGFDRPVVVGHSLGALAALECAGRPDAVRAAVLVDPAPILSERGKRFFARAEDRIRGDGAWLRRFADGLFLPHDDVGREEVVAAMAAAPVGTAVAGARAMAGYDGEGGLRRAAVPVLGVFAGDPEPGLAELCPPLVVGRTVGAGHFLQLQVPDQLNAMIARFLRVATS